MALIHSPLSSLHLKQSSLNLWSLTLPYVHQCLEWNFSEDTIPDGLKDAPYFLPISMGTNCEIARVFPCPERANHLRYGCSARTVVKLECI